MDHCIHGPGWSNPLSTGPIVHSGKCKSIFFPKAALPLRQYSVVFDARGIGNSGCGSPSPLSPAPSCESLDSPSLTCTILFMDATRRLSPARCRSRRAYPVAAPLQHSISVAGIAGCPCSPSVIWCRWNCDLGYCPGWCCSSRV